MSKSERIPEATPVLGNVMPCSLESLLPWLIRARTELAELKGMSRIMEEREGLLHPLLLLETLDMALLDNIQSTAAEAFEQQIFTDAEQTPQARLILKSRDLLMNSFSNPDTTAPATIGEQLAQVQFAVVGKMQWRKQTPNSGRPGGGGWVKDQGAQPEEIAPLLEDLDSFLKNNQPQSDPLVKWIMAAYQLETIQPFTEHNGLIAQVYLNLQLAANGLLKYPMLNLSGYLRRNQANYRRVFHEVRSLGNWLAYFKFMLHGISSQARYSREKINLILKAKGDLNERIRTNCNGVYSLELVRLLVTYPVISPLRLSSRLDIHYTTATRYLRKLSEEGFLTNRQSGKYQLYANPELISLLTEVKDEFNQSLLD